MHTVYKLCYTILSISYCIILPYCVGHWLPVEGDFFVQYWILGIFVMMGAFAVIGGVGAMGWILIMALMIAWMYIVNKLIDFKDWLKEPLK